MGCMVRKYNMNTQSNAYVSKFSSGTILTLLLLSGFLLLVPLTTNVFAAQNAVAPTVAPTGHDFCDSTCGPDTFNVRITNPASNQYAITAITLTFPASSGWILTATGCGTDLSTRTASSTNGVECTGTLPPGFTDFLVIGTLEAPTVTVNTAASVTITTTVQDAGSSPGNYAGPSFKVYGMDTPVITVTDTEAGAITAGGSDTITGTWTHLTGNVGNFLNATITSETPVNPLATANGALSVTQHSTDATGSITTVFTATVAGTYVVSILCDNTDCTGLPVEVPLTITVSPATATEVTVTLPGSTDTTAPSHYVTTPGKDSAAVAGAVMAGAAVSYSLADKYGNAIAFSTLTYGATGGITITALSGQGRFDLGAGTTDATITCKASANFVCPAVGTSATLPFNYYQSPIYGTVGKIGVTIVATGVSVSGTSGNIITSTFQPASVIPTVSAITAGAGSFVLVGETLAAADAQQGVPVTFYLDVASVATLVSLDGKFSTSGTNVVTVATNSTSPGLVTTHYMVDTGLGAKQDFIANIAAPIDGAPTNMLGNTTGSATVTTVAGIPSTFVITGCFAATDIPPCSTDAISKSAVNGTSVYVDVSIADAYGNPVLANPGPNQIEVTVATSAGLLSVSHAYITLGFPDTYSSLGWIAWTMPTSIGTGVTLTASGVLAGVLATATYKITTVSGLPTFSVTAPVPVSGAIYSSSTTVVFNGEANASLGYPTTTNIVSVGYKIGSTPWQSAVIAPGNQIIWSIAATFPVGLSTIQFNATDINSNTVLSTTYKVLVDTAAPKVVFTTASGAVLNYSQPAMAKIVDVEGDLNASSVMATFNGTAVASSNIAVTGTNTLGSNVTYTVSVKNIPVGTWILQVNGTNYAGLTGVASITVTVQVAFAQSVVINSAAKATLGSYTGVSVSATNLWSTSQNLVVFAVWKNSASQTVAVSTGGLTLASGATGTAFCPLVGGLPSGSYTVTVFVITTANNPVSSTTSIAATV